MPVLCPGVAPRALHNNDMSSGARRSSALQRPSVFLVIFFFVFFLLGGLTAWSFSTYMFDLNSRFLL